MNGRETEETLTSLKQKLIQESKRQQDYIVKIRRELHQFPETCFEEFKTQALIERELKELNFKIIKTASTGLIAEIEGPYPGKCIALRADIDGLNLSEEHDTPYKSQIEGKMHGCGHDAHTACLLGAAHIIHLFQKQLQGSIKLIFQPGEEGGGGAKRIVDEGHLEGVDNIFGIHVWEPVKSGNIGSHSGPLMASADMFKIRISGKGGHAAIPQKAIDPTIVLSELFDAFQKLVTREINPLHHALITTPQISGSKAGNVIGSTAVLTGTLRTFDLEDRNYLLQRIQEITSLYGKAWRCETEFEILGISYPPVINDTSLLRDIRPFLEDIGPFEEIEPTMGGEDFAFYQQVAKGVFLFLGINNPEKGIINPHHHPKFDVDEEILWKGSAIYSLLAFSNSLIHGIETELEKK